MQTTEGEYYKFHVKYLFLKNLKISFADFNLDFITYSVGGLLDKFLLSNLVKMPTCWENINNPNCINLNLTRRGGGGGGAHLVSGSMGTMCNPQYFQTRSPPYTVHFIPTDIREPIIT